VGAKYDTHVNRESAYEILRQRTSASGTAGRSTTTTQTPAAPTVGSQLGRQIMRGVLGGILGGTRRT